MPQKAFTFIFYFFFCFFVFFFITSCESISPKREITREQLLSEAPVLTPEQFLEFTSIEEGFELQLVASEPQLSTPIAMVFDHNNRIWAVEMEGYMPNAEGDGEEIPNGKVVILADENNDGIYENRKMFLDSLIMPRALALVDDGILIVEPPYLWFYEIKDDKPYNKLLIDSQYTEGGNVEAQANGLFRAMDNWIYSGGSSKRYRKQDNVWLTEQTHLRGQWGITQDDFGRLYYNNNSQNLLGDFFLPSFGRNNPNVAKVTGYNERIVSDNRTYPSRPTPGVNRGYLGTVLDDSLRLKSFTAACGPVIYRSNLFEKEYYQNAFVAEPAANLIKRNILNFKNNHVEGMQAYEGKEFISSDDERFRPVNLYNGPEGALYIVDMYRGIIQHKLFLTKYLKDEIAKRKLDSPLNCGRIYKVVPKGFTGKVQKLPTDPVKLVKLLKSDNSWEREKAQQLLVDRNSREVIDILKGNLVNYESFSEFIHSLWTLEGLKALTPIDVMRLLNNANLGVKIQALGVMHAVVEKDNHTQFALQMQKLMVDSTLAPYVAFQLHLIDEYNSRLAKELRFQLIELYPKSNTIADAILSNLHHKENYFANELIKRAIDKESAIHIRTGEVLSSIKDQMENRDSKELQKKYGRGISIFKSTCQPCHGADGNGIASLAPPLNQSEWVTGDKDKLIAIVLYGLSGPIMVHNKLYQTPEISGEMPGIVNNPDLVETDLALLLSYIRKNWNNRASEVSRDEIIKIKNRFEGRQTPFTAKELNSW